MEATRRKLTKRISVALDETEYAGLRVEAKRRGVSLSALAREVIRQGLAAVAELRAGPTKAVKTSRDT